MHRMTSVMAICFAGSLYFTPLLVMAQSGAGMSNGQTEAARTFRAYVDQDWKRWMSDYPVMATFIDFFRGKTDQDITVEVDRYSVWPGQALAYKIGQMKSRELRTEAEKNSVRDLMCANSMMRCSKVEPFR
jgi:hypothetical protein